MIHPILLFAYLFAGMSISAFVHGRYVFGVLYALIAGSMFLLQRRK